MAESPQVLPVALIQLSSVADPAINLAKAVDRIERAARAGAKLACLPELFASEYFCQSEDPERFRLAESVPGPTTEELGKVAAAHRISVVTSLFERRAEGVYHNTAVVIDANGQLAGRYRKMHIPDDPLYYEKYYFTPGDLGFASHTTESARVGAIVCWDQWFPESARLTALSGAQILCVPTSIGWQFDETPDEDRAQHDAWETVQRGHAIANGVFYVAVNRVGLEGGIRFWGQSFAVDPFGRVLARLSATEEQTEIVVCDLAAIGRTRRAWPFLRDRRIDAYDDLRKRLID